jgi:uncharacterized protein (TIGR01777 family)
MIIALTGASGFIGRHLRAEWPADWRAIPRGGAVPQEATAVVHLAGEPVAQRWTVEAKRRIRESRVEGTRALVNSIAARSTRPTVLISAAAIGLYGDRGDEWLDEAASPASGFLAEVSRDWEAEASRAELFGVRVVTIRFGLVLGRDGGALAKMLPIFRLGLGGRLGAGTQWMSWIHIDDIAGLIRFAIENDHARGVWNGVAPNPVTNREFTRAFAGALHRPAVFPVPKFALRLAAGEMSQILLDSQRCTPKAAIAAGYPFRYPTLEPALAAVLT